MADGDLRAQIFDVQRFSVHDGPGIRTTVFFQGCPLRCAWCQNPESQIGAPQLLLYPDLCMGCGGCAQACPAWDGQPGGARRPTGCRTCGRCVELCPTTARRMAGYTVGLDDLVALALRDRPFYGAQGGVTLGGGEPLAQWAFTARLADRLRSEGISVALDTAAKAPWTVIEDVPDHTDLVLADLKLVDRARHRHYTGVDNASILEALRHWSRTMPKRLWISVPLISGVQDRDELRRMAAFLAALENQPLVRLLPYHRLGDGKYAALGRPTPLFPGSAARLVESARATFQDAGLAVEP
jgi:glycyl-radical enzyme activating protein